MKDSSVHSSQGKAGNPGSLAGKSKSVGSGVRSMSSGKAPLLDISSTTQAKSGMILVSASSPLFDTVQPPPDERNVPMYGWMLTPDETLTVQDIDIDGQAYQVLKNTTFKEPEPELLPDREQLERNQSMEVLLARLNSQLLESSQEDTSASAKARQGRKKDTKGGAPPVINGKGQVNSQGSRYSKNVRVGEKSKSNNSQTSKSTSSKSDKSVFVAAPKSNNGQTAQAQKKWPSTTTNASSKSKSTKPYTGGKQ